jgi:hypothetical protein
MWSNMTHAKANITHVYPFDTFYEPKNPLPDKTGRLDFLNGKGPFAGVWASSLGDRRKLQFFKQL